MSNTNSSAASIHEAEIAISQVLRGGVLLSALLISIGAIWYFIHPVADGVALTTLPTVVQGVAHGDPRALIMLGLLVLLATPVVRVAVSIYAFAREHDWRFVVITSIVLATLLVSFVLGKGGA